MNFRMCFAAIAATLTFSQISLANESACSGDDVVLEATTSSTQCLTMEDLQSLTVSEFETSTIWTDGVHQFTGVLLKDLLEHLDAQGSEIKATAINDYTITIPVSDAVVGGPIVAYAMDQQRMSRRTKGPLWIVYPFDSSAKYQTETVYSRSIWQLNRISLSD